MENNYKYKTLAEFKKAHPKEYAFSVVQKFIDKLCEEMGWVYKKQKAIEAWTFEECLFESRKCKSRTEWKEMCSGSNLAARRNGWYIECTKHMDVQIKPSGYWTKERCIEEAKKYTTRTEWQIGHNATHQAARIKGWYNECITHMPLGIKPRRYWVKERCIEEAKKYETRAEWRKSSSSSYMSSYRNDWLVECTSHMK
jgi:hypothetical protein